MGDVSFLRRHLSLRDISRIALLVLSNSCSLALASLVILFAALRPLSCSATPTRHHVNSLARSPSSTSSALALRSDPLSRAGHSPQALAHRQSTDHRDCDMPSDSSFTVSSANAARHLRGRQAHQQTLTVSATDHTPGIRQVHATTRATSSALHTGTASTTCSKTVGVACFDVSDHHFFEPIFYEPISKVKPDSSSAVVDTEKADMKTKTHFSLTQTSKPKWLPATPFGISDHPHSCSIRPLLHHRHQCRLLRHGSRRGEGRHGRQNSFFCLSSLPGI
jgi:hypothetical protein